MPIIKNVTTVESEKVWSRGEVSIWKVTLEVNGKKAYAKTYSAKIAVSGWSGDVETYEKPNRDGGNDTFVRQPQTEARSTNPGATVGAKVSEHSDYSFYLAYGKDIVVALIEAGKLTDKALGEAVALALEAGDRLYNARPGAAEVPAKTESLADAVGEVFGDEVEELPL